jgi:hypothetical protein
MRDHGAAGNPLSTSITAEERTLAPLPKRERRGKLPHILMAADAALDKLRARFEVLLEDPSPSEVKKLERAIASVEASRRPPRKKGRPPLPAGTLQDLLVNADLQKLLRPGAERN